MLQFWWPIMLVITANTVYHLCAKSMPAGIHPFASLIITYGIAALSSVILFYMTSEHKQLVSELQKTNWLPFFFGLAIVGLELGYLYVYKVGWKISTGSLVANISVACVLFVIGALFYKEQVSLRQIFGVLLCISGILLVSQR
jgi:uncharacterized membrane protein